MVSAVSTSSARAPGGTSRLMGPEQYKKLTDQLKKKESQLGGAKKELAAHKGFMMRAMLDKPAYERAVAKLHRLEDKVKTLSADVKDLKRILTTA